MTAGGERTLGHRLTRQRLIATVLMALAGVAAAETMYKYRGEDGEWIYTDRRPAADKQAEVREFKTTFATPGFSVTHATVGTGLEFVAHNAFHAPVEVGLVFLDVKGVAYPHPDNELRWVVDARSELQILRLESLQGVEPPNIRYRYEYLPGDPSARHQFADRYLVPFSAGQNFSVTQAYPDAITHQTSDSARAIDIAMPIGTDVLAARDGIVFDVASKNYRSGLDVSRDGQAANIVRILHDDGTFSLYAHLNWNTIRVKPGDRVRAGQYIADSGNTGFSSGPHLHFAVQKNTGLRIVSLPVAFKGPGGSDVVPATGDLLTAYP